MENCTLTAILNCIVYAGSSFLVFKLLKFIFNKIYNFFFFRKFSPQYPKLMNDLIKVGNHLLPYRHTCLESKDKAGKYYLIISETGKDEREVDFKTKIERDSALSYYSELVRYLKLKNS